MTGDERGARPSGGLRAVAAVCLLAGLVLLVPTTYYSYLSINPPAMQPGDLYLGGSSGLVLALVFAVPALLLLTVGTSLARRTRAS